MPLTPPEHPLTYAWNTAAEKMRAHAKELEGMPQLQNAVLAVADTLAECARESEQEAARENFTLVPGNG